MSIVGVREDPESLELCKNLLVAEVEEETFTFYITLFFKNFFLPEEFI